MVLALQIGIVLLCVSLAWAWNAEDEKLWLEVEDGLWEGYVQAGVVADALTNFYESGTHPAYEEIVKNEAVSSFMIYYRWKRRAENHTGLEDAEELQRRAVIYFDAKVNESTSFYLYFAALAAGPGDTVWKIYQTLWEEEVTKSKNLLPFLYKELERLKPIREAALPEPKVIITAAVFGLSALVFPPTRRNLRLMPQLHSS